MKSAFYYVLYRKPNESVWTPDHNAGLMSPGDAYLFGKTAYPDMFTIADSRRLAPDSGPYTTQQIVDSYSISAIQSKLDSRSSIFAASPFAIKDDFGPFTMDEYAVLREKFATSPDFRFPIIKSDESRGRVCVKPVDGCTVDIPVKAHADDAGFDLRAYTDEAIEIAHGQTARIRTGLQFAIPQGYFGLIKERSSVGANGIFTLGGIIDAGYRGEVICLLLNMSGEPRLVLPNERFAQIVFIGIHPGAELHQVETLPPSSRAAGGFGSTGKA